MKRISICLVLLIGITAWSQGPWTKEKGNFYTQLSFSSIYNYNTLFGDPDYTINGEITDNTFQFYGEYGITDKTTLVVNIPYKIISLNNYENPAIDCGGDCSEDFNTHAFGNTEIGLKHNFYNKDWLISGQFSVEANTSTYNAVSGIRTGYNAFTFTPMVMAGKGFGKIYFQTYAGIKIRTNEYSSNVKIGGEYGYKVLKNIWLIGFIDIEKSLENGTIELPTENINTGLYVNNQEYGVFGIKAIGELSKSFGITAGLPFAFFGNNVAKQAAPTLGVYSKF